MLNELSNHDYHKDTSHISKSGLDLIEKSPAHYFYKYLSGEYQEKSSKALEIGSAVHCAVLEPERFALQYCAFPDVDRRTKEGKETLAAFYLEHPDKIYLSSDDFAQCLKVAEAVKANPLAAKLLAQGEAESTISWQDPQTGVNCKARPDFVTYVNGSRYIVDLKTTEDASKHGFSRSAFKYRYHVQAAFYCDGWKQAKGEEVEGFVFIAVEKSAPYLVSLYLYEEQELNYGRACYVSNLLTYANCLESQTWPGYSEKVEALALPEYITKTL